MRCGNNATNCTLWVNLNFCFNPLNLFIDEKQMNFEMKFASWLGQSNNFFGLKNLKTDWRNIQIKPEIYWNLSRNVNKLKRSNYLNTSDIIWVLKRVATILIVVLRLTILPQKTNKYPSRLMVDAYNKLSKFMKFSLCLNVSLKTKNWCSRLVWYKYWLENEFLLGIASGKIWFVQQIRRYIINLYN